MNTATHNVEVPFPQAFASPKRSPFPSAPRYGSNMVPPVERVHQAVRRECALLRDSTLALPLLLDEYGSIFTPGPSPGNPPKCDSIVKVLEA